MDAQGGEVCDPDGEQSMVCEYGETSCVVCTSLCVEAPRQTSVCGVGLVDMAYGENCDDMNIDDDDGCDSDCIGPEDCTALSFTSGVGAFFETATPWPDEWTLEAWIRLPPLSLDSSCDLDAEDSAVPLFGHASGESPDAGWRLVQRFDGSLSVEAAEGSWQPLESSHGKWVVSSWVHVAIQSAEGVGLLLVEGEVAQSFSEVQDVSVGQFHFGAMVGGCGVDAELSIASVRMSEGLRYQGAFSPSSVFDDDASTLWTFDFAEGEGGVTWDAAEALSMNVVGAHWLDAGPMCLNASNCGDFVCQGEEDAAICPLDCP